MATDTQRTAMHRTKMVTFITTITHSNDLTRDKNRYEQIYKHAIKQGYWHEHNECQTIVGPWWIIGFSVFLTLYLARIKNKYKIVYSFMVLRSEINVLEVINTDDIIKRFASQKEKKIIYINNIFIFCIKKSMK
jgi:hypothetical protein